MHSHHTTYTHSQAPPPQNTDPVGLRSFDTTYHRGYHPWRTGNRRRAAHTAPKTVGTFLESAALADCLVRRHSIRLPRATVRPAAQSIPG